MRKPKISIEYPERYYPDMDKAIGALASEYCGEIIGSGLGFQIRDVEIEFDSLQHLNQFKERFTEEFKIKE